MKSTMNLKPRIDFKKQPYAEPKFMLPPDAEKLPMPFEGLLKKTNNVPQNPPPLA